MSEVRTSRRLAAILAADVVGYSRMMAADETGTLSALNLHREAIFNTGVARQGGRVVGKGSRTSLRIRVTMNSVHGLPPEAAI